MIQSGCAKCGNSGTPSSEVYQPVSPGPPRDGERARDPPLDNRMMRARRRRGRGLSRLTEACFDSSPHPPICCDSRISNVRSRSHHIMGKSVQNVQNCFCGICFHGLHGCHVWWHKVAPGAREPGFTRKYMAPSFILSRRHIFGESGSLISSMTRRTSSRLQYLSH